MKKPSFVGLASWAVLALLSAPLHGATISTLFNTGVDASGNALADDSPDPHYTLVAGVGSVQTGTPLVVDGGFPINPWMANSPTGAWVGTTAVTGLAPVSSGTGAINLYYETSFSMVGLIPSTAVIAFDLSGDNTISDVLINGASTGITQTVSFVGFESKTLTAPQIALLNGATNTMTFVVRSATTDPLAVEDYYGLRVEFTTRTADAIPEPSALSLLGLGVIGLRRQRRRRGA